MFNHFSVLPYLVVRVFDLVFELIGHLILAHQYPEMMGIELTMMLFAVIIKVS